MIPKLQYISQGITPKAHIDNIQKACSSGAELVQLRLKNISEKEILNYAAEAREITSHFQTRLIINDHYKVAKTIKADGVHLGKTDACPTIARKHLYTWQIIGGTANTIQDCEALLAKEIDYISLGPFRFTTTKENARDILDLNEYTAIVEGLNTKTPIIGVGGITIKDITSILETGVSGIAVSGEITRDFNTIRRFNQLLMASVVEEKRHTFK